MSFFTTEDTEQAPGYGLQASGRVTRVTLLPDQA